MPPASTEVRNGIIDQSNFPDPDDAYRAVVEAHRGLTDEQSARPRHRPGPDSANHIGDVDVLSRGDCASKATDDRWQPAAAAATAATAAILAPCLKPSLRAKRSNPWRCKRKIGLLRRFAPRNDGHEVRDVKQGKQLIAKGFASTTDMVEKKITFSAIGPDLYAFTAEGDPIRPSSSATTAAWCLTRRRRRRRRTRSSNGCATVTDKPIKYVGLSHYHAVRVLGASAYHAQAILASTETHRLIEERGQQDWDSNSAAFHGCSGTRKHPGPDLADTDVRRRDDNLSRKARGAADAARRGPHVAAISWPGCPMPR